MQNTVDAPHNWYHLANHGKYSFTVMGNSADESIQRMKSKGVTFVNVDRAPFVNVMANFYSEKQKAGELPDGFLKAVEATR